MHPILRLTACVLLIAAGQVCAQTANSAGTAAAGSADPVGSEIGATAPKPRLVRNPAFYSTEVTVNSQNADERNRGMVRALGQVLVRLTGNPQAPSNAVIRRASANIDALVSNHAFRQESEIVNGLPVYTTILAVMFDPASIDALIAGAGLKYWSTERPKPILWLAIDDGRGPRLVTSQQPNVVKPLATRGLERGMRYLLPAGTAAEQAGVAAVWRLDAPALQVLTDRYRNDAQLIGKVFRQAPGWTGAWVLTQGGAEIARWSFSDADPRRVIASGADEGANALAKRDGVLLDIGVAGLYSIEVVGVNSQGDFIRLMSYLQTLAVVSKVTVIQATPEQLRLQLDLSVGMKGFRSMVGSGDVLRASSETGTGVAGSVPRFILQ
jgi:hypothetical protein